VYTVTFSVAGGRFYYNGPQSAALGLILTDVIKIIFDLQMSSILLGPIGPRAAREGGGGGKRAAGERVKYEIRKKLNFTKTFFGADRFHLLVFTRKCITNF
jgi:hypothetical protein